jgi:dephospho-CoA kinase
VGGIGSGKSAVADRLARYRKTVVIDADRIGHEVLTSETIKNQIRERFGPSVFDDGEVSRAALAKLVFGDSPDTLANRQQLEAIVHPEIEKRIGRQIEKVRRLAEAEVVVLDAAILLEAGWNKHVDRVVFVDAPYEKRLARVQTTRGWNENDLTLRERSQMPLEQKRATSDWTITNDDSLDDAARQLHECLTELTQQLDT